MKNTFLETKEIGRRYPTSGPFHPVHPQGWGTETFPLGAHYDGFTLMDLVSYNTKNNLTLWPFGPSDGGNDHNDSWDSGGNQALRRQRLRNFWTIQFFSRGVPMTVWGDEFGRTQNGNNNPYNIDSVATWNNYAMLGTHAPNRVATGYSGDHYHDNFGAGENTDGRNPLFVFVQYVLQLRNQHLALRQRQYADLVMNSGGDVTYQFKQRDGQTDLEGCDRCIWLCIDGSEVNDHDFLLLINMYSESVSFQIPEVSEWQWRRIIDTATWAEPRHNIWCLAEADRIEKDYQVHPFSIVVLEQVPGIGHKSI